MNLLVKFIWVSRLDISWKILNISNKSMPQQFIKVWEVCLMKNFINSKGLNLTIFNTTQYNSTKKFLSFCVSDDTWTLSTDDVFLVIILYLKMLISNIWKKIWFYKWPVIFIRLNTRQPDEILLKYLNWFLDVRARCVDDSECIEGAHCVIANATVQMQFRNQYPGRRCYCMDGYQEEDHECGGESCIC